MKSTVLWPVLLLCLSAAGAYAADQADQEVAVKAAESWLQTIDRGNYADSWTAAAPSFRAAVTAAQWGQQLQALRAPMGQLVSRQLLVAKYYTELPGAPDGQYWVIQEQTAFANKKSAVETITVMRAGKAWMPAGYFIR